MKRFDSQTITSAFADAAVDPTRWRDAMDTIARETGSFGAMLLSVKGATPNTSISESMRPGMEIYFRDGWYLRDERMRAIPTMLKCGFGDDFDFITSDEMRRHPYYQELLRPFGLQYFGLLKVAAGDDIWCVSIQRSLPQGPFSTAEKRELARLSEQVSSAAAVSRALGFAATNAASEAFEVSGSAVVLLNRRGEVLRLNSSAEALLDSELRIANKRLTSADPRATRTLERAVHDLLWAVTPSALMPPVVLPRQARRPVLAYLLKLSAISVNIFSECQAIVVLIDLEKQARLPQNVLRSSFGLSAAEARLAVSIASGAALERIADEIGISKETARNELKAIFQKTGTHRQAELVALLANLLRAGTPT